jgi:hypothetical protein
VSSSGASGAFARAQTGGIRVTMRGNFEIEWFQIAVAHLRAAQEARKRSEAAPDGSDEMGLAFDDETQATMVVIAAAAFAIDALYVKLDDMLDLGDRSLAKKRLGRIVETLKTSLDLGSRTDPWTKSIKDLFDLRDQLVHFRGVDQESQPHPTGKSNVSAESARYTVERATWAVDLAHEVLTVAYTQPRPRHKALVAWAASNSHVPAHFDELRQSVAG